MFASTSLNVVLGQSALILGLVASLFGVMATAMAVRTGNRAVLRTAPRYAWLILGAAIAAFVVMERALITRDWAWPTWSRSGRRRPRRCTTSPPCGAR